MEGIRGVEKDEGHENEGEGRTDRLPQAPPRVVDTAANPPSSPLRAFTEEDGEGVLTPGDGILRYTTFSGALLSPASLSRVMHTWVCCDRTERLTCIAILFTTSMSDEVRESRFRAGVGSSESSTLNSISSETQAASPQRRGGHRSRFTLVLVALSGDVATDGVTSDDVAVSKALNALQSARRRRGRVGRRHESGARSHVCRRSNTKQGDCEDCGRAEAVVAMGTEKGSGSVKKAEGSAVLAVSSFSLKSLRRTQQQKQQHEPQRMRPGGASTCASAKEGRNAHSSSSGLPLSVQAGTSGAFFASPTVFLMQSSSTRIDAYSLSLGVPSVLGVSGAERWSTAASAAHRIVGRSGEGKLSSLPSSEGLKYVWLRHTNVLNCESLFSNLANKAHHAPLSCRMELAEGQPDEAEGKGKGGPAEDGMGGSILLFAPQAPTWVEQQREVIEEIEELDVVEETEKDGSNLRSKDDHLSFGSESGAECARAGACAASVAQEQPLTHRDVVFQVILVISRASDESMQTAAMTKTCEDPCADSMGFCHPSSSSRQSLAAIRLEGRLERSDKSSGYEGICELRRGESATHLLSLSSITTSVSSSFGTPSVALSGGLNLTWFLRDCNAHFGVDVPPPTAGASLLRSMSGDGNGCGDDAKPPAPWNQHRLCGESCPQPYMHSTSHLESYVWCLLSNDLQTTHCIAAVPPIVFVTATDQLRVDLTPRGISTCVPFTHKVVCGGLRSWRRAITHTKGENGRGDEMESNCSEETCMFCVGLRLGERLTSVKAHRGEELRSCRAKAEGVVNSDEEGEDEEDGGMWTAKEKDGFALLQEFLQRRKRDGGRELAADAIVDEATDEYASIEEEENAEESMRRVHVLPIERTQRLLCAEEQGDVAALPEYKNVCCPQPCILELVTSFLAHTPISHRQRRTADSNRCWDGSRETDGELLEVEEEGKKASGLGACKPQPGLWRTRASHLQARATLLPPFSVSSQEPERKEFACDSVGKVGNGCSVGEVWYQLNSIRISDVEQRKLQTTKKEERDNMRAEAFGWRAVVGNGGMEMDMVHGDSKLSYAGYDIPRSCATSSRYNADETIGDCVEKEVASHLRIASLAAAHLGWPEWYVRSHLLAPPPRICSSSTRDAGESVFRCDEEDYGESYASGVHATSGGPQLQTLPVALCAHTARHTFGIPWAALRWRCVASEQRRRHRRQRHVEAVQEEGGGQAGGRSRESRRTVEKSLSQPPPSPPSKERKRQRCVAEIFSSRARSQTMRKSGVKGTVSLEGVAQVGSQGKTQEKCETEREEDEEQWEIAGTVGTSLTRQRSLSVRSFPSFSTTNTSPTATTTTTTSSSEMAGHSHHPSNLHSYAHRSSQRNSSRSPSSPSASLFPFPLTTPCGDAYSKTLLLGSQLALPAELLRKLDEAMVLLSLTQRRHIATLLPLLWTPKMQFIAIDPAARLTSVFSLYLHNCTNQRNQHEQQQHQQLDGSPSCERRPPSSWLHGWGVFLPEVRDMLFDLGDAGVRKGAARAVGNVVVGAGVNSSTRELFLRTAAALDVLESRAMQQRSRLERKGDGKGVGKEIGDSETARACHFPVVSGAFAAQRAQFLLYACVWSTVVQNRMGEAWCAVLLGDNDEGDQLNERNITSSTFSRHQPNFQPPHQRWRTAPEVSLATAPQSSVISSSHSYSQLRDEVVRAVRDLCKALQDCGATLTLECVLLYFAGASPHASPPLFSSPERRASAVASRSALTTSPVAIRAMSLPYAAYVEGLQRLLQGGGGSGGDCGCSMYACSVPLVFSWLCCDTALPCVRDVRMSQLFPYVPTSAVSTTRGSAALPSTIRFLLLRLTAARVATKFWETLQAVKKAQPLDHLLCWACTPLAGSDLSVTTATPTTTAASVTRNATSTAYTIRLIQALLHIAYTTVTAATLAPSATLPLSHTLPPLSLGMDSVTESYPAVAQQQAVAVCQWLHAYLSVTGEAGSGNGTGNKENRTPQTVTDANGEAECGSPQQSPLRAFEHVVPLDMLIGGKGTVSAIPALPLDLPRDVLEYLNFASLREFPFSLMGGGWSVALVLYYIAALGERTSRLALVKSKEDTRAPVHASRSSRRVPVEEWLAAWMTSYCTSSLSAAGAVSSRQSFMNWLALAEKAERQGHRDMHKSKVRLNACESLDTLEERHENYCVLLAAMSTLCRLCGSERRQAQVVVGNLIRHEVPFVALAWLALIQDNGIGESGHFDKRGQTWGTPSGASDGGAESNVANGDRRGACSEIQRLTGTTDTANSAPCALAVCLKHILSDTQFNLLWQLTRNATHCTSTRSDANPQVTPPSQKGLPKGGRGGGGGGAMSQEWSSRCQLGLKAWSFVLHHDPCVLSDHPQHRQLLENCRLILHDLRDRFEKEQVSLQQRSLGTGGREDPSTGVPAVRESPSFRSSPFVFALVTPLLADALPRFIAYEMRRAMTSARDEEGLGHRIGGRVHDDNSNNSRSSGSGGATGGDHRRECDEVEGNNATERQSEGTGRDQNDDLSEQEGLPCAVHTALDQVEHLLRDTVGSASASMRFLSRLLQAYRIVLVRTAHRAQHRGIEWGDSDGVLRTSWAIPNQYLPDFSRGFATRSCSGNSSSRTSSSSGNRDGGGAGGDNIPTAREGWSDESVSETEAEQDREHIYCCADAPLFSLSLPLAVFASRHMDVKVPSPKGKLRTSLSSSFAAFFFPLPFTSNSPEALPAFGWVLLAELLRSELRRFAEDAIVHCLYVDRRHKPHRGGGGRRAKKASSALGSSANTATSAFHVRSYVNAATDFLGPCMDAFTERHDGALRTYRCLLLYLFLEQSTEVLMQWSGLNATTAPRNERSTIDGNKGDCVASTDTDSASAREATFLRQYAVELRRLAIQAVYAHSHQVEEHGRNGGEGNRRHRCDREMKGATRIAEEETLSEGKRREWVMGVEAAVKTEEEEKREKLLRLLRPLLAPWLAGPALPLPASQCAHVPFIQATSISPGVGGTVIEGSGRTPERNGNHARSITSQRFDAFVCDLIPVGGDTHPHSDLADRDINAGTATVGGSGKSDLFLPTPPTPTRLLLRLSRAYATLSCCGTPSQQPRQEQQNSERGSWFASRSVELMQILASGSSTHPKGRCRDGSSGGATRTQLPRPSSHLFWVTRGQNAQTFGEGSRFSDPTTTAVAAAQRTYPSPTSFEPPNASQSKPSASPTLMNIVHAAMGKPRKQQSPHRAMGSEDVCANQKRKAIENSGSNDASGRHDDPRCMRGALTEPTVPQQAPPEGSSRTVKDGGKARSIVDAIHLLLKREQYERGKKESQLFAQYYETFALPIVGDCWLPVVYATLRLEKRRRTLEKYALDQKDIVVTFFLLLGNDVLQWERRERRECAQRVRRRIADQAEMLLRQEREARRAVEAMWRVTVEDSVATHEVYLALFNTECYLRDSTEWTEASERDGLYRQCAKEADAVEEQKKEREEAELWAKEDKEWEAHLQAEAREYEEEARRAQATGTTEAPRSSMRLPTAPPPCKEVVHTAISRTSPFMEKERPATILDPAQPIKGLLAFTTDTLGSRATGAATIGLLGKPAGGEMEKGKDEENGPDGVALLASEIKNTWTRWQTSILSVVAPPPTARCTENASSVRRDKAGQGVYEGSGQPQLKQQHSTISSVSAEMLTTATKTTRESCTSRSSECGDSCVSDRRQRSHTSTHFMHNVLGEGYVEEDTENRVDRDILTHAPLRTARTPVLSHPWLHKGSPGAESVPTSQDVEGLAVTFPATVENKKMKYHHHGQRRSGGKGIFGAVLLTETMPSSTSTHYSGNNGGDDSNANAVGGKRDPFPKTKKEEVQQEHQCHHTNNQQEGEEEKTMKEIITGCTECASTLSVPLRTGDGLHSSSPPRQKLLSSVLPLPPPPSAPSAPSAPSPPSSPSVPPPPPLLSTSTPVLPPVSTQPRPQESSFSSSASLAGHGDPTSAFNVVNVTPAAKEGTCELTSLKKKTTKKSRFGAVRVKTDCEPPQTDANAAVTPASTARPMEDGP